MTKDLSVSKNRDKVAGITKKRSSKWPKVEHEHLKLQPNCACCGGNVKLNVHHKKPFHLFPDLELDHNNLITLCMEPGKECHIKLGHGDDFKAYNPNVEEDVKAVHEHFSSTLLEEYAAKAKAARLLA